MHNELTEIITKIDYIKKQNKKVISRQIQVWRLLLG